MSSWRQHGSVRIIGASNNAISFIRAIDTSNALRDERAVTGMMPVSGREKFMRERSGTWYKLAEPSSMRYLRKFAKSLRKDAIGLCSHAN
jgi:hypothetical protein